MRKKSYLSIATIAVLLLGSQAIAGNFSLADAQENDSVINGSDVSQNPNVVRGVVIVDNPDNIDYGATEDTEALQNASRAYDESQQGHGQIMTSSGADEAFQNTLTTFQSSAKGGVYKGRRSYTYKVGGGTTEETPIPLTDNAKGVYFTVDNDILAGHDYSRDTDPRIYFHAYKDKQGLALHGRSNGKNQSGYFDNKTRTDAPAVSYSKELGKFIQIKDNISYAGYVFDWKNKYSFGVYSIGAGMKVDDEGRLNFSHYIKYRNPTTRKVSIIMGEEKVEINNKTGKITLIHGKGYVKTPNSSVKVKDKLTLNGNQVCLNMSSNIVHMRNFRDIDSYTREYLAGVQDVTLGKSSFLGWTRGLEDIHDACFTVHFE